MRIPCTHRSEYREHELVEGVNHAMEKFECSIMYDDPRDYPVLRSHWAIR